MAFAAGLFLITDSQENVDPTTQAAISTTLSLVTAKADGGSFFAQNTALTITLKGGGYPAPGSIITLDLT